MRIHSHVSVFFLEVSSLDRKRQIMALASAGWKVYVTLADHGDNRSTLSYQTDPATVVDGITAQAAASDIVADLDALTNAVIVGYRVEEIYYEDSIALPADGIENENKASVTYSIDGNNKKGNFKIPAPVSAIFGTTGGAANQVNTAYAPLQAYADNFRTAGEFVISDGEKLDVLLVGKRVSAKNNNG